MRASLIALLLLLPAPAFAAPDAACLAELKTATAAPFALGPYELTTDVASPYGDTHTVMELISPIAMHSKSVTSAGVTEMTVIDHEGWMSYGGEWEVMAPEMVEAMRAAVFSQDLSHLDTLTSATCEGIVVLDSRPARKFTYAYAATGSGPIENEYYIDATTGVPLRAVSVSKTADATITVTSTYRFDATIVIKRRKFL